MNVGMLGKAEAWLRAFKPSLRMGLMIAFVFGFVVRMVPEILSYPYPIGFDTIYYGWRLKEGVVLSHWSSVFGSWLFYGLTVPVYGVLGGDPFVFLKFVMPLLFGLNACGVHYLATRGLGWSTRKGLFAAGLFSFQLAALRISSDLYRNILGLGILLFAVPWILKEKADSKSLMLFGVLSLLAVFSHEYVSVLLLASVFGVVVSKSVSEKRVEALKVVGAALPAVAVFVASVFLRVYPVYRMVQPNILVVGEMSGQYSGPLFFITNYLAVSDTVPVYVNYFGLFVSVVSLFVLLYVAILPLAVIGFFRNKVLDFWLILLGIGGFGCLLVPFFALTYWDRWMIMLVFPLVFYATNGFVKILHSAKPVVAGLWRFGSFTISKRVAKGFVLVSVVCGFVFITSPMFFGKGGVYCLPATVTYLPSTILANTIPVSDVEGTVEALRWIDVAMDGNSCFLAHHAFFNWARIGFCGQHTIVFFKEDIFEAVDVAVKHGFGRFWLVWWNTDVGWYGFDVPDNFTEVTSSGRISVFEYQV